MRKYGRLAGKVAIVSGAAPRRPGTGNGSAVATLFAREGASVLIVNRTEEHAQELRRAIEHEGGECSVCVADVTEAGDAERVVATAIERYGRLDILHNNVGGGGSASRITEMAEGEWNRSMDVNLKSVMWCCKYSVPQMRRAGGGSIINISSIAGAVGLRDRQHGFAAYSAAKAGVIGLTRALAAELAPDNIRVNCIVVGLVDTPMVSAMSEETREKRRRAVPLQTTGTGWDVGWAAVYLASDESRWVTGIELPIDAGQMRLFERPG